MVPAGLAIAAPVVVLAASLIIDRTIGDPHSSYHPVALLGRCIGCWGVPARFSPHLQRVAGVLFWLLTVAVFAVPVFLFSHFAPWYLYLLIAPFLLKCCFAWRSLEEHAGAVVEALNNGTDAGRETVKMLVSRDTAALDREHILSAAYESMTENLTDSIISPLLFYAVFGIGGAAFFRAANTLDAMLGYRDERERLGWFSARMDDVLNFIPARLTVLYLLLYFAGRGRFSPAITVMRRDGKNRPGFNGGIVMGAMAGGVGIRFEKPGVYTIGDPDRSFEDGGGAILWAVRSVAMMGAVTAAIVAVGTLFLLGSLINSTGI